jgi:hypothetical protein
MATALAATPQAGSALLPPRVLLQVTGAPSPPANAYGATTFASADSWTSSGTGANATLWTAGQTYLWLRGASSGAVGNVITASRTVTGLTIGAVYRFRVTAAAQDENAGTTRLRITGGATGAYVTLPAAPPFSVNPGADAVIDLSFTATATSHVINLDQKRGSLSYPESVLIRSASVQPTGTWLGTGITRTDVNGTAMPVREDVGGLDTVGGVLTLTDYEAALIGPVVYTVTDGLGATATATTSLSVYRRNLCPNPNFETNITGWGALSGVSTPTRSTSGPYSGLGRLDAVGNSTGTSPRVYFQFAAGTFAVGETVTMTARIRQLGTWPGGTGLYTALRWGLTAGGETIHTGTATFAPDASGWMLVTVTGTVPAGANGLLQINLGFLSLASNLTAAGSLGVDEVLIERAAAAGAYFDGSTPTAGAVTHYWEGAANASASVETSPLALPGVWLTLPATATPSTPVAPGTVKLEMVLDYEEAAESNGSLHTIINRADKIANPGPMSLRAGTLELYLADYTAASALRTLLAGGEIAQIRQPDYPDLDLYLSTRSLRINPSDEDTATRRWIATLAYEEVLAP